MKEIFTVCVFFIFVLFFILGIGWIAEGNNFFLYKVFAPQYEQVRNNTFHNSQMYNDGMKTELAKMQYQYKTANNQNQKDAICDVVRHDFASYDTLKLSPDLQDFYNTCNN